MATIKSLHRNGNKWFWRLVDDDNGESTGVYFTDNAGEGIFLQDDKTGSIRQITGTCQFRACKTASGMRRKLKRFYNDL